MLRLFIDGILTIKEPEKDIISMTENILKARIRLNDYGRGLICPNTTFRL